MEEKNYRFIKEQYQAATYRELPVFIQQYADDERSNVKSLVEKAQKKIAQQEKEIARTEKMYSFEEQYSSYAYICGIDEVGRGPLAGPVVAGAVILPKEFRIMELNDSKQVTEKKREELDLSDRRELMRSIFYRQLMRPCVKQLKI